MAPDVTPRHEACPACGAALRPGSPWCTLCYADLRPPPEPPPPPATPATSYGATAGDPLTQPLLDFIAPPPRSPDQPAPPAAPVPRGEGWPCLTCGAINPLEAARCSSCGSAFLAAVTLATRKPIILPWVGDLSRLSRAERIVGALGIAALIVIPVAILSLLLAGQPKPDNTPGQQPTGEPTITVIDPGSPSPASVTPTPTPTALPTAPGVLPTATATP